MGDCACASAYRRLHNQNIASGSLVLQVQRGYALSNIGYDSSAHKSLNPTPTINSTPKSLHPRSSKALGFWIFGLRADIAKADQIVMYGAYCMS